MEIELGRGSRKGKSLGIAGIAVVVALVLLDFVVLRGELVDTTSVDLSDGKPGTLDILRVGEEHLVEISTRRRHRGESKGRSVSYRLLAPDGEVIAAEDELVSRKTRFIRFEPKLAGEYQIFVQDEGFLGASSGHASVSVYVNDHRILARFFPF